LSEEITLTVAQINALAERFGFMTPQFGYKTARRQDRMRCVQVQKLDDGKIFADDGSGLIFSATPDEPTRHPWRERLDIFG
jgi:hypothetical protein